MKLPAQNSRAMAILQALRGSQPLTPNEGVVAHGSFKGMRLDRLTDLYNDLVVTGCLVQLGPRYALSKEAAHFFDPDVPAHAQTHVPVVPPRQPMDVFSVPPLDLAKYGITPLGMRPGSNDYRAWPSVNAPFTKAGA